MAKLFKERLEELYTHGRSECSTLRALAAAMLGDSVEHAIDITVRDHGRAVRDRLEIQKRLEKSPGLVFGPIEERGAH